MAAFVELSPKREFINPNFDHYQLSLDKLAKKEVTLNQNVDVAKPSESSFSSHHAKLYSLHNHLFADPWDPLTVYFFDKDWKTCKVSTGRTCNDLDDIQLSSLNPEFKDDLFQVPNAANIRLKPARFNVSLGFPSDSLSLVVDGVDHFFLLSTENRSSCNRWKPLYEGSLPQSGHSHQLVDCCEWREGEARRVALLVAGVEEVEGEVRESHGSPYITCLTWITLLSVDDKTWSIDRTRRLESSRPFDYACLESDGSGIHMVAPNIYKMTHDSLKPVEPVEPVPADDIGEVSPLYTWNQTGGDVTVHITIPEGVTKSNLSISITTSRLEVSVKNDIDMIKGDLFDRILVDSSTWTLDGRRLEISLEKCEESMWSTVVVGDTRGELVMTEEQVEAIHQRLAHLTSDSWNGLPDLENKPYNTQMLEECDAVDGDGVILARIDGELHRVTHKAISSNQFLFTVRIKPAGPSAICLRHDVDGFLWQATSDMSKDSNIWEHVGVLNAFGYVLASKQQRRFCSCSEDMSTAVIADAQRHIYIYRQKVKVLSPVRNRKTGTQINTVAKQQVISLDCSPDHVVGLQVSNTKLFVLTEQKLLSYTLDTAEE